MRSIRVCCRHLGKFRVCARGLAGCATVDSQLLRHPVHNRRDNHRCYCHAVKEESSVEDDIGKNVRVIDMRSDVLTKPNSAMRKAMANAIVGDDVFREDPTIFELEAQMAELVGKEAALFVPSGTMGNLLSVMAHCANRGEEIILGDQSHLFLFEQGGIAQVASVHPMPVTNRKDGTWSLDEMTRKIRPLDDVHQPLTRMVALENTHNAMGGRVVPRSFIDEVGEICKQHNLILHMDGARLMNAAYASGDSPADIVRSCDSVCLCLSKGLGAPIGSLMAGSADFIQRAIRHRKVLGGGMRQPGVLAAAGLVALSEAMVRMEHDHEAARIFAKGIAEIKSSVFTVEADVVESNIIMINILQKGLSSDMLTQRLREVTQGELDELKDNASKVIVAPWTPEICRAVTHYDLSYEDMQLAVEKCKYVIREYEKL